jgi:Ca2+:H+ antiporter
MLLIGLASLILPTAFKIFSESVYNPSQLESILIFFIAGESGLVALSRGAAIVLLVMFGCYLYFFYYTHSELTTPKHSIETLIQPATFIVAIPGSKQHLLELRKACLSRRGNKLSYISNIIIMIPSAALMVLSSIFMLEAIDSPSSDIGVSKSFIGLVIVPIIIGAAEQVTTALRAYKRHRDEIEWIIEVAIASSIRTSLFVLPLVIILGWILDIPGISLFFDGFQVTMLSLAILLVNYIIHAGTAQPEIAHSRTAPSGIAQSVIAPSGTAQSEITSSGTAQSEITSSGTAQSEITSSGTAQSGTAQSGTAHW